MALSKRNRRGANAIEFALTLPIAIAILAGIIDYGWLFFQQEALETATRDGARTGSVSVRTEDPILRAETATKDALDLNGLDSTKATVSAAYEGVAPDERLTVTTTMPFSPLFGLIPVPVRLRAQLSMRLEAQVDETGG